MRGIGLIIALCLGALGGAAHAATTDWIDWKAARDGAQHTYTLDGFTLRVSGKAGATPNDSATPVLTISAPGAAPVTLTGVEGYGDATALIGIVRLDSAAAKPQVLFLTFSDGAHCCTTLNLATLTGRRWRTFQLTYDGAPDKGAVFTRAGGAPVLAIGDENFDYAFASHAGSYLVARYYGVRGGQLFDVSGEARFTAVRKKAEAETLGYCRQEEGTENGACAAYVAEASLAGDHATAWRKVQGLYKRGGDSQNLPEGCTIDVAQGDCPKADVLTFTSFPTALTWFLWRFGYAPVAPTFPCGPTGCHVPMPKTPRP
jgi:hypothetical protein